MPGRLVRALALHGFLLATALQLLCHVHLDELHHEPGCVEGDGAALASRHDHAAHRPALSATSGGEDDRPGAPCHGSCPRCRSEAGRLVEDGLDALLAPRAEAARRLDLPHAPRALERLGYVLRGPPLS